MEDPLVAARRELHELTILTSALLRLATKVQARCDTLRHTLGDSDPLRDEEVDHHAPRNAGPTPPLRRAGVSQAEEPAALLAMSLAGEGLTRAQISEYLHESFGMQDIDALLDRVLPDQV
jgi:hypothetical protein